MTSSTYPTYNLLCSRIRPVPSSSTSRYGFSIDYTDPYPSGQQSPPIWVSCLNSGTHSRSFLAKEDAGLRAPLSARAPSTCTAMHSMHMPGPQGSNAPVQRIEEEVHSGSMLPHPYHEPRARAHPGGLTEPIVPLLGPPPAGPTSSVPLSTLHGSTLMGTNLSQILTVGNNDTLVNFLLST